MDEKNFHTCNADVMTKITFNFQPISYRLRTFQVVDNDEDLGGVDKVRDGEQWTWQISRNITSSLRPGQKSEFTFISEREEGGFAKWRLEMHLERAQCFFLTWHEETSR